MSTRLTIFAEMTEVISTVADSPCENVADNPTAVTQPGCGTCWICRARNLLARIERQARRGQKKSPTPKRKPRSRARRQAARRR